MAALEDGGGPPEDEVDVALEVAVAVVLAVEGGQGRRVREQGVLVCQQADVVKGERYPVTYAATAWVPVMSGVWPSQSLASVSPRTVSPAPPR